VCCATELAGFIERRTNRPCPLSRRHNHNHTCTISWLGREGRTVVPRIFGRSIVHFLQTNLEVSTTRLDILDVAV
jgi:hypothetical protein